MIVADKTTKSPNKLKGRKVIDILIVVSVIAFIAYLIFTEICRPWYYSRKLNTPVESIFKVSETGEQFRGTDEMVDHINKKVKEFLENSSSKSVSTSIENGIWYIIQHRDNFFEDDEVMENLMSYGWLLEYGSSDEITSKMGEQVAMVVKYMYRHQETLNSDFTTGKLQRINEYIDEILKGYGLYL